MDLKVRRINRKYVKDDCVQVMFGFRKGMTIDKPYTKELLFNYEKKNDYYNNYLDDERRKTFPYGNIAVHREIKGFRMYNMANQILNFDIIYRISYSHGKRKNYNYSFCKVIKDNKEALLLTASKIKDLNINLEKLKNLETLGKIKIKRCKEPKFRLSINKNITREDIIKGKKLYKKIVTKKEK
jgi:hypothetical protein